MTLKVKVVTPKCFVAGISKTAGDTDLVAMEYLQEMGYGESNGLVLDDVACHGVCRSSYSELITYCHSTFTIDKIAWKYRKTAIEKASVYHTVNGNRALFHTSKTAKMIKVILLSSTLTF